MIQTKALPWRYFTCYNFAIIQQVKETLSYSPWPFWTKGTFDFNLKILWRRKWEFIHWVWCSWVFGWLKSKVYIAQVKFWELVEMWHLVNWNCFALNLSHFYVQYKLEWTLDEKVFKTVYWFLIWHASDHM